MGGKNLIKSNRKVILEGMRDGIPIGLGYLAVSFSLGIAAKTAGLNAFQSFLASLLCNASAGEYSGFTVIAADSSYFVIALATLVANARYLLMSCALSQRISKNTSIIHRLLLGFFVTDEFLQDLIFRLKARRKSHIFCCDIQFLNILSANRNRQYFCFYP